MLGTKRHLTLVGSLTASPIRLFNKTGSPVNNGSRTDIPLNTSGDYTLFNESMSVYKMQELKKELHRPEDEKRTYKDAV